MDTVAAVSLTSAGRVGTFAIVATLGERRGTSAALIALAALIAAGTVTGSRLAAQARSLSISEIQGPGARSPVEGQLVSTTGIVTGRKTNGFFIQTPDSAADGDPRTSEGVFVFTSSAPAANLTPGTMVGVTGRVLEFAPNADPQSPPLTEIESPTVEVRGAGATLPSPIEIAGLGPTSPFDTLERLEGMRVVVPAMTLVAPTLGSVTEAAATGASNGVFYGVIRGVARPMREPGIDIRDPLPPGSPCCIPRWDSNPERIRVDSDGQPGAAPLNLPSGSQIRNVVGPLDYGFRSYTILPDPASPPIVDVIPNILSVVSLLNNEFGVATMNLGRFFDTADDPTVGDVVMTTAGFQLRLAKLSLFVRDVLKSPDLLAVQEVENLGTLQTIAAVLNRDAVAAGELDPHYEAYLEEGNDPSGIDVGVLVKRTRVEVLDYDQVGKSTMYVRPDGRFELLHDRPPFVLAARFLPFPRAVFTFVVTHMRSLNEIDSPTDGARVRLKRAEQAEYVADIVQERLSRDPDDEIIVLGDLNAFEFNDGYVDVVGTMRGAPPSRDQVVQPSRDRLDPNLTSPILLLPATSRYSYVFDGTAQTLDHILITTGVRFSSYTYVHGNADAPEVWRSDPRRPERVTDHDAVLIALSFSR